MPWILLASIGHVLNAAAFIVDKSLLSTALKRSGTYAALLSLISLIIVVALPWVKVWPQGTALIITLSFGGLFTLALWFFFEALKHAETSRVVPIIGSLVPLFTLIGTWSFLGERLTNWQLFGFACLLAATWLLTRAGDKRGQLAPRTLLVTILSAALFAASSVLGKAAYNVLPFFSAFTISRLGSVIVGLLIAAFAPGVWQELMSVLRPKHKGSLSVGRHTTLLAVGGQLCGGIGFILIHLALSAGSAPIVNALQAIQYAAIFLVAWFGGKKLRHILQEQRSKRIILIKVAALALVVVGLFLIT